ncbi:S-adenosylmethionine mitochondrial carrier protein [Labeo rohita]|uniref:Mitochondrial S-adenosylmethionine carrier protein n=1 Tax=Labeo rohita TaxID=84645 RepID=A0ABQ8M9W1_LABRO|nr:S-adenosylmethionine mitochondrial carrier protein [Labeo rohita]
MDRREFTASLVAGGCAGMCVDLTLFPLDTIKTRLQSQQGFYKAGGFRGIYAGVPSAAIGSFPNAAAFFVTYESTKSLFTGYSATNLAPITHMLAASLGEIVGFLSFFFFFSCCFVLVFIIIYLLIGVQMNRVSVSETNMRKVLNVVSVGCFLLWVRSLATDDPVFSQQLAK